MMINGRNAYPDVVADKLCRIRDPHVAPINALADEIADHNGLARGMVPYVDPDLGGVDARALVLLDNPSTKAETGTGSGLLSLDNDDRTARNCREMYLKHGIDWREIVHWNVCPFPTENAKNGGSYAAERARGAPSTRRLVALLPHLEIVLPLGANARDGWRRADVRRSGLYDFAGRKVPHCSNRGLNQNGGRAEFERAVVDLSRMRACPCESERREASQE
ncbi:MAG TPA: uracil-DNA glycosylase [Aldersonia sp.]